MNNLNNQLIKNIKSIKRHIKQTNKSVKKNHNKNIMQLSHFISPNQSIICNTFKIEGINEPIKSYNLKNHNAKSININN